MGNGSAFLSAWNLLYLGLGLGGTWLALRYARRRGLMDQPGERRSHALPTPRGGGISIAFALFVAIAVLAVRYPEQRLVLVAGGAGLLLVAGIGWLDDHRPLSPWPRLVLHAVSAALLGVAVLLAGKGILPAAISALAALVLVNVWNFMDGIDGLAASQAAIAGVGYALAVGSGGPTLLLGLALTAACCGFLPFNFPRARIFMGDVGSGALGAVLALILVLAMTGPVPEAGRWPLLLLPLSAFLVDAALTLARRMMRGEPWWTPHVQHAYQVWSRRKGSHVPVTMAYAAWSVAGTVLMVVMLQLDVGFIMAAASVTGWCLMGGVTWLLLQVKSPDGNGRVRPR